MPTALTEISDLTPHFVQVWIHNSGNDTGAWTKIDGLFCENLRRGVQPGNGISRATLSYEYGEISTNGGEFDLVSPLGTPSSLLPVLLHAFARVAVLDDDTGQLVYWAGIVVAVSDERFVQPAVGHPANPNASHAGPHPRGTQIIEVLGPEYLLNRKQIVTSFVFNHETESVQTIRSAIPFNIRSGRVSIGSAEQFGNQAKAPNSQTFATNLDEAIPWKAGDIARYLFDRHFPTTMELSSSTASPDFAWDMDNETVLDTLEPAIDVHGQTIYQVLNQLADARRWLHYTINYINDPVSDAVFGTWRVAFNTSTRLNLSLPSGQTIAGNPNTVSLLTSGTVDAGISLSGDAQQLFSQVIVLGARRGIVATVDVNGDFLNEGWTADQKTRYEDGAAATMATTAWNALSLEQKERLNKNLRMNEVRDVFTRFVCPVDADFDELGITASNSYVPGLRWLRETPLKVGWDYSAATPAPRDDAPKRPEYRRMFSLYKLESSPDKWGVRRNACSRVE